MGTNFILKLVFLIFFLIIALSCKKSSESVEFYYDYFPLIEGTFIEYDVTSIKHYSGSDTTKYKLKTVVGDTVIDNSARIAHKFFRYIYDTLYKEYKVKDLWTAIIDENRAELVEENKRRIKLVFAPTKDKKWNINAFNFDEPLIAFYNNIHEAFSIGIHSFDQTVKIVNQYKEANLIESINHYEVYAQGVGLIKKYYKNISYSNFDSLHPTSGEELYYNVINYGKE